MTEQVATEEQALPLVAETAPARDTVELVGRRVPRSSLSSRHAAALGSHRGWLRHLFSYRDTIALVIVFVFTQLLDAATTMYALSTGRFSEANPFLGGLVSAQPVLAYLFKMGIAVFVLFALLLMRLRWRMRRIVILLFALTSLVAPVANILRITGHM
ncbi:MAG: DUF5658 family protein [Candidatus Dormibacteria bacterium]